MTGSRADRHIAFIVAASLFNAAVAILVLRVFGTGPDGVELALRVTARVSFVYFVLAFLATPLRQLASRSPVSAWLVRHRRALGVTFGISMSMHVALILRMFVLFAPERPPMVTWADFVIGVPGLILVAAMTMTSFDRLKRSMSARSWRRLHSTGLFVVWSIFFLCLVDSAGRKQAAHPMLEYHLFIAILVAAMSLRIGARLRPASA